MRTVVKNGCRSHELIGPWSELSRQVLNLRTLTKGASLPARHGAAEGTLARCRRGQQLCAWWAGAERGVNVLHHSQHILCHVIASTKAVIEAARPQGTRWDEQRPSGPCVSASCGVWSATAHLIPARPRLKITFLVMVVSAPLAWKMAELCFSHIPISRKRLPLITVPRGKMPLVPSTPSLPPWDISSVQPHRAIAVDPSQAKSESVILALRSDTQGSEYAPIRINTFNVPTGIRVSVAYDTATT